MRAVLVFLFFLSACNHTTIDSSPNDNIGTVRTNESVLPSEKEVLVSFVCRHEEIIMKLAYFDSQSKELAAEYFFISLMARECIKFERPSKFIIEDIITEYKDYENETVVILKIKKDNLTGYVLVIKNKLIQDSIKL